jgi:hypothetical protein
MKVTRWCNNRIICSLVLSSVLIVVSFAASASTITLSGSGQMYWTAQFLGSAGGNTQTTPSGNYGNTYSLGVPGEYAFLDQFTSTQSYPLLNSSNVPFENSGTPVGTYAFQDTYEFSISSAASGDLLAVSLNLPAGFGASYNISDLQFRLYEVPPSSTPGLVPPAGSTIITNWMGISGNDNGNPIGASFTNIQSGTYFLDIAGTADGSLGGQYTGQLELRSTVPLPGALALLLSGLSGLGGLFARRRGLVAC